MAYRQGAITGNMRLPTKPLQKMWIDEYILTGVYFVSKFWYSRIIRVNIIFSKFYLLLAAPGVLYHFVGSSLDLSEDNPSLWITVFTCIGVSAVAHFFFSITMNVKITSLGVQSSIYIFMITLWLICFIGIGAIVAANEEDLYAIWMVVFLIAALIDFLIMDHIYVLFKLVILKVSGER
jgi:hypothetical protein